MISLTGLERVSSKQSELSRYQFDMNFTDCSFIIEKDGQIVLNYYVWGDVNFSNCDFTVSDSTLNSSWNKAIKIDAYSGSNGNHDLTVTIEGSTLNDSPITGDNARQLVYNSNEGRSNDVTTVFVDPDEIGEGEETVTLMDHSANETVDQDTIAPESAAENALEIETRAEEILEVEIVNAEPAPVCAADSAATETTGDVSAESDIGDAE